ncbi:MAG: flagellar basal body rod protein FlgB [Desulfobacterales bacterium]|nr:flagellar basal body rod protein FlgB [Desulfobacterales bacterium]
MSDGFKILENLIHLTNMRHGVIASNIANVDTPDYKARDVKFEQILGERMELKTTNPKHLKNSYQDSSGEIVTKTTQEGTDKNNVNLDTEVAKMTENAMLYQAGISMLSIKIRMFKNALRR